MKLLYSVFTALMVFLLSSCHSSPATAKATASPVQSDFILDNVNVIDVVNRRIIENRRIHIENGVIAKIEPAASPLSAGTVKTIDGADGYITPGLIDMHVHMYEEAAFTFALSHGVTHVRIMNGIPAQLRWRDQVANGEIIGSTASVSSPIISAYEGAHLHRTVLTVDEMKIAVNEYHQQGYDLIKAYGNLSTSALAALVEESKKLDFPVAKHGPHASGDMPVSALTGFQSFEHAEDIFQGPLNYEFAPRNLPDIIAELKETQVPITPTLAIFHQLTKLSEEKQAYLDTIPTEYTSRIIALEAKSNQVERWLNASSTHAAHNKRTLMFLQDITRALYEADVPLLVGSDSGVLLSPHGLATHTEMMLMHEAGIPAIDVLRAATVNPAKALKLDTTLGQIDVGFAADFVYSVNNPLDDLSVLSTPDAVTKQGNWYSAERLKALREAAIEDRSFWAEITDLYEAL